MKFVVIVSGYLFKRSQRGEVGVTNQGGDGCRTPLVAREG